ncbi:glycosyltransferase family 4 protein [Gracilimonas sp.]|uniref:glycosyltransferase family 4 protein n=1 Tax=Gracilimonas sp. TaxID=1974203 RepID=UPI003BA929DE
MQNTPKVLFIHLGRSSFVKEDLAIMSNFCSVSEFYFHPSNSIFTLTLNFIRQFFWLIKEISSAKACYCWFSDYHGVLPLVLSKLFNTPFIVVLGGFDCNKLEKLDYGIFCSAWRAPLGRFILRNSSYLLPVDEHLISTDEKSEHWGEAHPNGVKKNVQGFNTPWKAVPTGYNPNVWNTGPLERSKTVTTVALVSDQRTALIKGWDLFIETARLKPEFQFNIVGCSLSYIDQLKDTYSPPKNVHFIPPQPREGLEGIYQKTSVYMQLSRAEGLPNVLCEAMMCGCIPIGSPVFGIPNAIGDTGHIIYQPKPEKISEAIDIAHGTAKQKREKARAQISENFSLSLRSESLKSIFMELKIIT